ncbi:MAG: hypothetical protein JXA58_00820, partial [Dehalococcoidia bacterium]|nr:hypothetical protein [Dehalococcoidia bacterium]
ITYTISYGNTGQTALTSVVITDDPDEDYVASIGNISDGGIYAGGIITWNVGSLDPGGSGSVTYEATLRGTSAFSVGTTTVDNIAVVTTDQTAPEDDDASVTVTVRRPPSGGGGSASFSEPSCWFDVDMLGEVTRIYVTCQEGRCIGNYEPDDPSDENYLDFTIGTRVTYYLDEHFNGGPPRWVRMREMESPPPLSPGQVAVTPVYSFLGYTATGLQTDSVLFDSVVGMQLDYDPDDLPENATGVGIAGWNPDTHEWEFLPQASGRVAGVGTATADVLHFSTFAVIATTGEAVSEAPTPEETPAPPSTPIPARFVGQDLVVEPTTERLWAPVTFLKRVGNTVTITATIANLGEESGTYAAELMLNGEVIGSQDVVLEGGDSSQVRFVVSHLGQGDYTVQVAGMTGTFTSSSHVTWWLIALICVVSGATLVWYVLRRRRRRLIA